MASVHRIARPASPSDTKSRPDSHRSLGPRRGIVSLSLVVKSIVSLIGTPNCRRELAVPKKPLIIDFDEYDLDHVVSNIDEIRRYNPQRFEMEQLTAIVFEDPVRAICVGYKDLKPDEFWARGHMPGFPLMPGVIMCEAAAQLSSYYAVKNNLMSGMMGFGGMEDIRFRGLVRPGDRFVVVCRLLKSRRTIVTCEFQAFVDRNMVCEGLIKGIPLPTEQLAAGQEGGLLSGDEA
jgi:3-hydroxyacyl-[acyl-carrier-protein] dehydratase